MAEPSFNAKMKPLYFLANIIQVVCRDKHKSRQRVHYQSEKNETTQR